MKIVFIDLETSGLPNFDWRARDPRQPHVVQAAALLCDDKGNILESFTAIAKPEGWEIPPELTKIHGISNEHALKVGISEKEILVKLLAMIKGSQLFIAYNEMFDRFVIRCGLRRFDLMQDSDDAAWKAMKRHCAMKVMIDVCKCTPKIYGRWKYPKLSEAYRFAFGEELTGAHDALEDIKATHRLYQYQVERGLHG